MKKLLICISVAVMLLCCSTTAFAGSIAEDLLYDDYAMVFFAQVVEYKVNGEKPYIKAIPVKIVKGDVELGEEEIYPSPTAIGDFRIKKNKVYLFISTHKTAPTYLFRASGYDAKTLDLIDVDEESGIWHLVETYLTDGKYDEAEAKRREKLELSEQQMQVSGELPPLHVKETQKYAVIYGIAGISAVLAGVIVYKIKWKKKEQD